MIPEQLQQLAAQALEARRLKLISKTRSLSAGETYVVANLDGPHWILMSYGRITDKDATVTWELDGTVFSITPSQGFDMGVDDPNPVMPFITKYDPTNDDYAFMWTPVGGIKVDEKFRLIVTATNACTGTLLLYYYVLR